MNEIEQRLLKRKTELETQLEALKDSAKPVDLNDPIGRLSRMDAIQQQQMALNSKNQIKNNLELLVQAQERLQKGEYGICLSCEEEIEEKRLRAKPEAAFCLRCTKN